MNGYGADEHKKDLNIFSLYVYTSAASFLLCLTLFYFVSPRFSARISSGYCGLSVTKKTDWDTRIGSNLHAVVVSTISLYCFLFDPETTSNPIRRFVHFGSPPHGNISILFRCEISTPFVNQRWFFDAIGHPRSSSSFVINGYVMGASFFFCRILMMPIYYYKCYLVWGSDEQQQLGALINFYWISTCIVLDIINLYWFTKIVKGAMKLTRKLKDCKD
ncbi:transmembrane protein 56-like isoform X2 [Stylophora pistillata]|uniref:transmembrane protein 56-like isoform X2 n=1 Tax=Stylophora pistillata TaxID=50429 RepID=UPI000C04007F|nr:transmembrane protein 56-like isoform X2 [Stylophora pistillata]